jgi:hypothetical protein
VRAAAWITLGVLVALSIGAGMELTPYVRLVRELRGRTLAERGQLASDPARSFPGRAGRIELRRRLASSRAPEGTLGDVWRWCFEASRRLPPDARVWLGAPVASLYFYASFFWLPARVDVTPEPAPIRDQRTLSRHARTPDRAWLVRHGYTHLVTRGPAGGLRLVELPADAS